MLLHQDLHHHPEEALLAKLLLHVVMLVHHKALGLLDDQAKLDHLAPHHHGVRLLLGLHHRGHLVLLILLLAVEVQEHLLQGPVHQEVVAQDLHQEEGQAQEDPQDEEEENKI